MYTKTDDMRAARIVARIQAATDAPTRDLRFAQLDALLARCGVYGMVTRSGRMSPSAALSVARIAVWKAARRYDPARSSSFIAYAIMKMRYDVRKAHTTASTHRLVVHVPRDVMARFNATTARIIDAELAVGHFPDADEAAAFGVDADAYASYNALRRFENASNALIVDEAADADAVTDFGDYVTAFDARDAFGDDDVDSTPERMTARAAWRYVRKRAGA